MSPVRTLTSALLQPANAVVDDLTTIDIPPFTTKKISLSAVITTTPGKDQAKIVKSRFTPTTLADTTQASDAIEGVNPAITTTILKTSTTTLIVMNSSETVESIVDVTSGSREKAGKE